MREELSFKHIRGSGIEIGALHCPLPVLPGVKVTYVDHGTPEEIKRAHGDVEPVHKNWVIDNAERLYHFNENSQDFIIANHVFEHCEDPILTIANWFTVLKPGGMVFAAIPDKRYTFDQTREVTTWEHLEQDYMGPHPIDNENHYRDWFTNALVSDQGKDVESRVQSAIASRANIHFHVWDESALRTMFDHFKSYAPIRYQEFHPNGAEVIVLAWKAR